jgi:hypothetical protein
VFELLTWQIPHSVFQLPIKVNKVQCSPAPTVQFYSSTLHENRL